MTTEVDVKLEVLGKNNVKLEEDIRFHLDKIVGNCPHHFHVLSFRVNSKADLPMAYLFDFPAMGDVNATTEDGVEWHIDKGKDLLASAEWDNQHGFGEFHASGVSLETAQAMFYELSKRIVFFTWDRQRLEAKKSQGPQDVAARENRKREQS